MRQKQVLKTQTLTEKQQQQLKTIQLMLIEHRLLVLLWNYFFANKNER